MGGGREGERERGREGEGEREREREREKVDLDGDAIARSGHFIDSVTPMLESGTQIIDSVMPEQARTRQ